MPKNNKPTRSIFELMENDGLPDRLLQEDGLRKLRFMKEYEKEIPGRQKASRWGFSFILRSNL